MQPDDTNLDINDQNEPQADGYYGDEGGDDEVDLSFLDDDEQSEE